MRWSKKIAFVSASLTGGCYVYLFSKNNKNTGNFDDSAHYEDNSYIYLPENTCSEIEEPVDYNWSFWKKYETPVYWRLFLLSRSKSQKIRHAAINELASCSLEKWQYTMIAQASDMNTSVGLARTLKASPDFFLKPPFKDLDEGNLQLELYLFLTSLSPEHTDLCVQNLLKQVEKYSKSLLKNEYSIDLEVGDPSVLYHSQQKKTQMFVFDKLCLQTILSYSSLSFHRQNMIQKGILKLLLKTWIFHKNDIEMLSLIAQILSNFALEERFKNPISMSGWIGILAEWVKSCDIKLSLPAAKALANLDNDDRSDLYYDNDVYVLHPISRISKKELCADVVFVHGLLGATFWTWRQNDSQRSLRSSKFDDGDKNSIKIFNAYTWCWPKDWLSIDFPFLRLVSVDYKTCLTSWSTNCSFDKKRDNLSYRAKFIINKLLLSHVGERPIVWIAHSMGGLLVKQILTEAYESHNKNIQSLASKTAGVIFFSVPHFGSELANKIHSASLLLLPSSDIIEMQKGSRNLSILQSKFKSIITKYQIPILSFGETEKSHWSFTLFLLVPPESSDPGYGEFYLLPTDHLGTCKPLSCYSTEYIKVLEFLKKNVQVPCSISDNIYEISKIMCLIP